MPQAYGNPGPPSDSAMYEDSGEDAPMAHGDKKMDDSGGPTAVIPKALLGGKEFKPGDEVVLQIVSLHGDEAVVKYATETPHDEEAESPETPPHNEAGAPPGGGGDAEMASMME